MSGGYDPLGGMKEEIGWIREGIDKLTEGQADAVRARYLILTKRHMRGVIRMDSRYVTSTDDQLSVLRRVYPWLAEEFGPKESSA